MALDPALRKAAILVASLDVDAADRLLEQMGEQQASRVRGAILSLDEVPTDEQEAILAEFFGRSVPEEEDEGVEFAISAESQAAAAHYTPPAQIASNGPRFPLLQEARAGELAKRLEHEHPQLIALVASHLPAERAADLLRHFDADLQTEVLERLGHLDEANPDVLAELERELERFAAAQPNLRRGQRLDQVKAILNHLDQTARRKVVVDLAGRDPAWNEVAGATTKVEPKRVEPVRVAKPIVAPVARVSTKTKRVAPAPTEPKLEFAELLSLSSEEFFAVFEEADPRVVMLALAGAPRRIFERYVGQFSIERAAEFERHIEQLRPLRLRDVETAQLEVARIADRQRSAAKAAAENSRRFAAAA